MGDSNDSALRQTGGLFNLGFGSEAELKAYS